MEGRENRRKDGMKVGKVYKRTEGKVGRMKERAEGVKGGKNNIPRKEIRTKN